MPAPDDDDDDGGVFVDDENESYRAVQPDPILWPCFPFQSQ